MITIAKIYKPKYRDFLVLIDRLGFKEISCRGDHTKFYNEQLNLTLIFSKGKMDLNSEMDVNNIKHVEKTLRNRVKRSILIDLRAKGKLALNQAIKNLELYYDIVI